MEFRARPPPYPRRSCFFPFPWPSFAWEEKAGEYIRYNCFFEGSPFLDPLKSRINAPSKILCGSFKYPIFLPFFRQILLLFS